MIRTITSKTITHQRALLRVDFNVDLDEKGRILSDFRMRATLPTIEFLLKNQAEKVIIVSHLGRPKGKDKKLSLLPIAKHLEKILKQKVIFVDDCIGEKVKNEIETRKEKIFVLENLRFYEGEENNDKTFAQQLAELADIYVNDAFGVSHRLNASVAAITQFLPSYAGLLLTNEVKNLTRLIEKVVSPFVVVLGGAKISTKLPLIDTFLKKADSILLGGGLANTVWKAWDFEIGKSLFEAEQIEAAKNLGSQKAELIVPGDFVVASSFKAKKGRVKEIGDIDPRDVIVDIGPISTKVFCDLIKSAKTILWNGPMGYWENKAFRDSTIKIARAIANSKGFTVVGGGDTLTAIEELHLLNRYSFVSTGGGAMLEFLAKGNLPALDFLMEK
ncbi:MAG TPA: phosphoglycerate kinase [Candidatus Paceibacterota bacterium]|nr:phosphoglycerate kinase [Candidatus Paceibacterota bacterium]